MMAQQNPLVSCQQVLGFVRGNTVNSSLWAWPRRNHGEVENAGSAGSIASVPPWTSPWALSMTARTPFPLRKLAGR